MSDFLFSSEYRTPGELKRILERWLGPVTATAHEHAGGWGTLATVVAAHDTDPVHREGDSISVLAGEPFLATPAPERRRALHRMLLDGGAHAWDQLLDGQFAALALDTSHGVVLTDLFSWIPVYAASSDAVGLVIGTHVDAVAEAAGVRADIDLVSAAELMGYFTIAAPRTLYRSVTQVSPGSTRRFGGHAWSAGPQPYWQPVEREVYATIDGAAEALRSAVIADVERAVDGHGEIGLMLSGGEDARAVLGAVPRDIRVRCFSFTELDNREVRAARRVARAYGSTLTWQQRPPRHDLTHFEAVAAMTGSQHEFIDVHWYNLVARDGLDRLPVVLGGFSADALLKADNLARAPLRRVRRGEPAGIGPARPPRLAGVRLELLQEAAARRDAFRRELATIRPASAEEWSFLYPFSMRKYAAGPIGNRRMFRAHEPFMSNAVVKLASEVPQGWKVDRRLYQRAMRPLLARSWWLPHSRNRLPYFSHRVNLFARPLLGLARDIRDAATGSLGLNQESWPRWEDLAESAEMDAAARAHRLADSPLHALFDNGNPDDAVRGWPPLHRLAAMQLALLMG